MKQTILIFTKKKFIKFHGRKFYKENKSWVDRCNGQQVFYNDFYKEYYTTNNFWVFKQECIKKIVNI
jgi:hypothetical protein